MRLMYYLFMFLFLFDDIYFLESDLFFILLLLWGGHWDDGMRYIVKWAEQPVRLAVM
jgi:hypothetical protein